jgi:hypothetical protein
VLLYVLGKGYRVLQVDNRVAKDYCEKIFASETRTDDTDARLTARMGFLHELVGEEFSIQPVLLMNPDAAALREMVHDLAKLQKEITPGRNQLQQTAGVIFPELKTFFKRSTAAPAAGALLEHSRPRSASRQLRRNTWPMCCVRHVHTAMPLAPLNTEL